MIEEGHFCDEVDMVYNNRRRGKTTQSLEFQQRLADAIANDLAGERSEEEGICYPYENEDDDDDAVADYIKEECEASDEEEELIVEANGEYDEDDEDDDNKERLQLVIQQRRHNQPVVVVLEQDVTIKKEFTVSSSVEGEAIAADPSAEGLAGGDAELSSLRELETQHYFIGKDVTHEHNISRSTGGPTIPSSVPNAVFKKLITPEMATIIVKETNRKATEVVNNYNARNPTKARKTWTAFMETEFYAYLGVLIASGVSNNNFQLITELWKTKNLPIFRATLSLRRFMGITCFIRFDNGNTRQERLKTDKAAAISDIWLMLNANLQSSYRPHSCITIDEQLFPYRGRTRFTQFIPSKPAKYGLKVSWACDSESHYPLKGILYTGKNPDATRQTCDQQGERILLALTSRYANCGRAIKSEVDTMDQMLTHYTTKRRTKRWPLAFFYNIVDIATLASYIICKENEGLKGIDSRKNYMITLSELLATPHIEVRKNNRQVMKEYNTRSGIEAFFGKPIENLVNVPTTSSSAKDPKRLCYVCNAQKKLKRKTRFHCITCEKYICLQHCKIMHECNACYNIVDDEEEEEEH